MMRSALWIPAFDELADPMVVARLAAEAEEFGWHGFFLWDRLSWPAPVRHVADPGITLAAVAIATEKVRIGPMVTPLARRRPAKVARETATLDRLSGGRLILGVGLGSNVYGQELSRTGEEPDDRVRAAMLDEALAVLEAAWSGEPVHHQGAHYTIDGIQFLPRPVQGPSIPVWVAGPIRRAKRYEGYFPLNITHPDQVAALDGPYDIAVALPIGTDPAKYAAAGATWWMPDFEPETLSLDLVRGVLHDGPMK
jgi:alkanesulfonate monooxygenase SsuD/methylene tetrahydromethanopterin reductase-like flavin-dependent oxidoreductase (luciferase family)